jgi:nitrogen fixation-related uncharacterized protein
MKNKGLIAIAIYLIMMFIAGFGFGWTVYEEKYNDLKDEYFELEKEYNILEIQYKRDLESCYQQMGDMQDDYDVNNDGVVDAVDYVAIRKYIMNGGIDYE